jgi:predicted NACHT family NTPase
MAYSGTSKVELNRRLGDDWRRLADALDIPASEQRGFQRGEEGLDIWEWLQQRRRLPELENALKAINRSDLLDVLVERLQTTPTSLRRYYQTRRERWPPEQRYALDKHFVQLTLLLDQGEEAQGQRLAPQSHKFQDLRQLLQELPDYPALVLLGPPGSGKSTLLCHVELDYAQEVLARDDKDLAICRPAAGGTPQCPVGLDPLAGQASKTRSQSEAGRVTRL